MCAHDDGDRKMLFAEVKSRSDASLCGMHRCHIELTDVTPGGDLLLSQELVSSGHALSTPESIQVCTDYYMISFGIGMLQLIQPQT
jgi:hypothetical protein